MKKATLFFFFPLFFYSCKKDSPAPVSYTKVSVTKLTILASPATNNSGGDWDNALAGYYPDVYFKITNTGTTTALYSLPVANRQENMKQSDLPVSWAASSGAPFFVLSNLSQVVDVDLYDYESIGSDEYMGSATFNFSSYTSGSNSYPPSITVTTNRMSIKLDLIWLQ
ncbi:MAG: hypothetical protein ACK5G0_01090 [Bacteroidota bacterium]|jgi:hypothetical protein